jgi:predicted DNA-binding protein with PD1-like motif
MRAKVLSAGTPRVIAVVFDTGEEPVAALTAFARDHGFHAASFSAIGAFQDATLGYFDWEKKDYERIEVREQVEVLSLLGDLAFEGENARVHAHVVLGRRDGTACGGHLLAAHVRPPLEVILTQAPGYMERVHDPVSGLALIRLDR